jgi:hypothetical protein
VVILYEKNSGNVRHIHTEAAVPGAVNAAKQTLQPLEPLSESKIFEIAKQNGHDTSQLEALYISPTDFKPSIDFVYHVDVKTKTLVKEKLERSLGLRRGQTSADP